MRSPANVIPKWDEEPAARRAETCIAFLAIHGLLSDGEKAKVRGRLRRAVDKWNQNVDAGVGAPTT